MAVAPYSKWFGVAVFSNANLLHFAVCKYYDRTFDVDGDLRHATKLINEFKPTIILVKALTARQLGAEKQANILNAIKHVAGKLAIRFTEVDLEGVKHTFLEDRGATLEELFVKVGTSFPELSRMTAFQNRSQRGYYTPVLSAVAIGASFRPHKGIPRSKLNP